jgi:hypothetical protein
VAFDTSLQMFIPRKLNSLRRLFSDYGMRFLNELLCFLCCATQSPPLGILAIIKVRSMSDCACSTRLPCLAIVADMLRTYQK